jgi:hypothetical protein
MKAIAENVVAGASRGLRDLTEPLDSGADHLPWQRPAQLSLAGFAVTKQRAKEPQTAERDSPSL